MRRFHRLRSQRQSPGEYLDGLVGITLGGIKIERAPEEDANDF
jgi:hypothetical protein